MGEEMMEAPKSYVTKDGYIFELVNSGSSIDLDNVQQKMKAAESIGLETVIIPTSRTGGMNPIKYEIHYYKYTKLDKDVLKYMKREDTK